MCLCGHIFEAHLLDRHAASCNRYPKTRRHELFGRAVDDIYLSVGATVERAEGSAGGVGPAPYATVFPVGANGQPGAPKHVYPDKYISHVPGKTVRLVVDHTVVDPQTASYASHAATEAGYAAKVAAEAKRRLYTPLLQPGDELLVPAAETHGAITPAFRAVLGKLAGQTSQDDEGGEAANRGRRSQLLRVWQIDIAMQLLRGRLDGLQQIRMKVYGTQIKKRIQQSWAHSPAARWRFLPSRSSGR